MPSKWRVIVRSGVLASSSRATYRSNAASTSASAMGGPPNTCSSMRASTQESSYAARPIWGIDI
jgi:hypothetical protein